MILCARRSSSLILHSLCRYLPTSTITSTELLYNIENTTSAIKYFY